MIQWPAPAKLNLFLYITGQRLDGYHNLQTLFQLIDYGDKISIKVNNKGTIRLLTPIDGVNTEENLIIRAARLLMHSTASCNRLPMGSGADIIVEKRIPMGSGLGGGSSNAATILVALNHLWGCGLSQDELAVLGLSLGADVPFFIHGHTAFAENIGEALTPIELEERWYLVAYPGISISTKVIFKDPELLRNSPIRSMNTLLKYKFSNNFEPIVRKRFHEVDVAFSWLLKYAPARLTGAGSCIFAEFNTECIARQVLEQAPKWLSVFIARGMNTSSLLKAICKNNDNEF